MSEDRVAEEQPMQGWRTPVQTCGHLTLFAVLIHPMLGPGAFAVFASAIVGSIAYAVCALEQRRAPAEESTARSFEGYVLALLALVGAYGLMLLAAFELVPDRLLRWILGLAIFGAPLLALGLIVLESVRGFRGRAQS